MGGKKEIRVRYFALLRDEAGRTEEVVPTTADTPRQLYAELRSRYDFRLPPDRLTVAVNDEMRDWETPLAHEDTVVFIAPVAGGR